MPARSLQDQSWGNFTGPPSETGAHVTHEVIFPARLFAPPPGTHTPEALPGTVHAVRVFMSQTEALSLLNALLIQCEQAVR